MTLVRRVYAADARLIATFDLLIVADKVVGAGRPFWK